jgi:hypothetical protein
LGWQDQGRQEHGWFGNGTASARLRRQAGDDLLFESDGHAKRATSIVRGSVAAVPRSMRMKVAVRFDPAVVERTGALVRRWAAGRHMSDTGFAAHFLGRAGDDPVAQALRRAARRADQARGHDDLRRLGGVGHGDRERDAGSMVTFSG